MASVLVFDSGVGGLSVLDAIAAAELSVELDYLADNAWLPYGAKADADVAARVPALIAAVARQWTPDIVVIACNTASTIALEQTRSVLACPVIGVVPPVKPAAALTKTGVIGLLATPATVKRAYTQTLIDAFAADKTVVKVGSTALVHAAEQKLRGRPVDRDAIAAALGELFAAPSGAAVDVVALSCTHFPLLLAELIEAAPRALAWVDSGAAIARRVATLAQAESGRARARRAGFTDAESARELHAAFAVRGFDACAAISPAPDFCASPL